MRPAQRGAGSRQVDAHAGLRRRGVRARLRVCLREVPRRRARTVLGGGRRAQLTRPRHGGHRAGVLAIDDLQWADRDTLLLLSELLTVAIRNVLVLGAHRAGEFDSGSAGFTSPSLRSIDLRPLAAEEL